MELIQLLEVQHEGFSGTETHTYELYSCDMVQAITSSANAYWHHRTDMEKLGIAEDNVIREAKFWVTSDGGFIGAFENYGRVLNYFHFYLRGKILTHIYA